MTFWQIALLAALALAGAALAGLWAFQSYGVYRFDQGVATPAEKGLDRVRVATFVSEDGAQVSAWIAPPADGMPVLVSFFGNFASIGNSAVRMKPLLDRGYGMAMLVYRGSGGAPGSPTEAVLYADARALYDGLDGLIGQPVAPERRVIHGLSLGSAVAVALASERPAGALIIEAGYDHLCRFFQKKARGLPLCALMWRERHDAIDRIGAVRAPILFAHGARDRAILPDWSHRLFEAAPEPKRYILYPEGGHADLFKHGLVEDLDAFLRETLPAR